MGSADPNIKNYYQDRPIALMPDIASDVSASSISAIALNPLIGTRDLPPALTGSRRFNQGTFFNDVGVPSGLGTFCLGSFDNDMFLH